MSLNALVGPAPVGTARTARRLAVALLAIGAVACLAALIGIAAGSGMAPPARNPFGTGLRETSAGSGSLGAWLLSVQSEFHRHLTALLAAVRSDGGTVWSLLAFGFLYGVFHAAGPGHGKGVIASYIVATRRTLLRGLGLSAAAALVQALVAIALVGVLAALLRAGAAAVKAAASWIELASFVGLLLFGLVLVWRKAGAVVVPDGGGGSRHDGPCTAGCRHVHGVTAAEAASASGWREGAAVVLAAGLRPCSGAVILLVLALSQGLFGAGIAAVLAMSAGTALTTGALACLAVLARGLALRAAGRHGPGGRRALACLEVAAAAAVPVLGATLLAGSLGA